MTGVLIKREKFALKDTEAHRNREGTCGEWGRDWNDVSKAKEHQGLLATTGS